MSPEGVAVMVMDMPHLLLLPGEGVSLARVTLNTENTQIFNS